MTVGRLEIKMEYTLFESGTSCLELEFKKEYMGCYNPPFEYGSYILHVKRSDVVVHQFKDSLLFNPDQVDFFGPWMHVCDNDFCELSWFSNIPTDFKLKTNDKVWCEFAEHNGLPAGHYQATVIRQYILF